MAESPPKKTMFDSPRRAGSALESPWLAFLVGVFSALLMTWPLAADLGHQVLEAAYFWDAYANSMILGSRLDAWTGAGPLGPYDDYFFAPLPDSIVFNENHFGLSLLFAPFYLLTRQPLFAYNATLLVSMSLSVFFTYLLVKRLTKSGCAGIWAGVAFAFCPYVMFEIGRIQLVATQWIPACFLMLHRAIETGRRRDIAGFWLCFLLQIGTCLYYAMFLIPLLGLLALVLLFKARKTKGFYLWFVGGGAAAAAFALAMVWPYFSARKNFDLERSLGFASGYDGKLSFLLNVHETNRTLVGMHHLGEFKGAYEEIAFPGFVVIALLLVGWWTLFRGVARTGSVPVVMRDLVGAALVALVAFFSSALFHNMLLGMAIVGWALARFLRQGRTKAMRGKRGLYLLLLLLSICMFLGLYPFEWRGEPVRGIYYFFHTYFPGFNGIRKVSRQAVMISFLACVGAGFGAAWLFSRLPGKATRGPVLGLLLLATLFELRTFPHPVRPVWAGETAPDVLRFVREELPREDLVASVPQDGGISLFRGDAGMALHNYLALYHKHRFVNGQSSWMPAVTELMRRVSGELDQESSYRALVSAGARHIIVYGEDLPPSQRDLVSRLLAQPERYRQVFRQGSHFVFSLVVPEDETFSLLETPALPQGARLVPRSELGVRAAPSREAPILAIDGNEATRFSTGRPQGRGHFFEVMLQKPRRIVAIEIENPGHVWDAPASFLLSGTRGSSPLVPLVSQPQTRLYAEQVFSPKTFVLRIVLPEPVLLDRLRLTTLEGFPGFYFSIYEMRLFDLGE